MPTAKEIKEMQVRAQFKPFLIDFNDNQHKINCVKLLKHVAGNSFAIYRGIDSRTSDIYNVYEYKISLERNTIYDSKKLETCEAEVDIFILFF